MPGIIPHLIAGLMMSVIGLFYFSNYLAKPKKDSAKRKTLLVSICLVFSIFPDCFLGLYYLTPLSNYTLLVSFHIALHLLFIPVVAFTLFILKYHVDVPEEPLWVMGFWCIGIHIAMDLFIPEMGILI